MTNKEVFQLIKKNKRMLALVPETVLLTKHKTPTNFGEMHSFAKLTDIDVFGMRHKHENHGTRICDLAREYDVSYQHAHNIINYKTRNN